MNSQSNCLPLTPGLFPAMGEWRRCNNVARAVIVALSFVVITLAARDGRTAENDGLFRRDNLVAWCIVPFDAKKRGPEERAAMLAKLGFKHFAYDYRPEHAPTFEAEIEACKRHGVSLDAWWFPGSLNDEAKHILALCQKHRIHPQLWISGGGTTPQTPAEFQARVEQEANRIRPIAEAAAAQDMKVGLYNHGGWFGEPETQLAIIQELKLPNVGIVYNQHHGHAHVGRFAEILRKTLPHLLCVNLNGMDPAGDQQGRKILQLGQGSLDLELLRIMRDSGYRGPVGILGHTQDDAEARLQDNLDGLNWLLPQLDGKPAGAKPTPRTPLPGLKPATTSGTPSSRGVGYVIAGRDEYRTLPLTVEIEAKLTGKSHYNILAACDTKKSPRHWELFTMPKSGALTVYLPGRKPEHVRTIVDVCDGKPHRLAMHYEASRVRLLVDDRLVADEVVSGGGDGRPGTNNPVGLAIGRLVEGGIGCEGEISSVRLSSKTPVADAPGSPSEPLKVLGHWKFDKPDATEVADLSPLKNSARRAAPITAQAAKAPEPPPGVHLKPVDPRLKVTLIDRSPDQVYLGVKVDRDGHVFVGGREGVFVFETLGDDKFAPRQEILRFPQDSIIMGLEFRDDDLFVLTCNALYRVPRGRVQRTDLKPEPTLWGLPLDLHVSFHCLAWGPDGKLYITHGDPWLGLGDWSRPDHWGHWILYSRGKVEGGAGKDSEPGASATGVSQSPRLSKVDKSWRETPYCGQGAVLRFDVETGSVEVVATGLRGPVGLAFDSNGELFTNDNDHESRADQYAPAKLLHVAYEGIDFGWPRGWMASKSPDRLDLNEPVCDLGRGVPCDLTFYRNDYLPEALHYRLLMCRWDRHAVTAYLPKRVDERTRTIAAGEESVLVGEENCRPVGIAVGIGGELFVTAVYMTGNMAAPYCASDLMLVTRADPGAPLRRSHFRRDETLRPARYGKPLPSWGGNESLRRLACLESGRRLTSPYVSYVPPAELPLVYPQESSFFKRKQRFWGSDEAVDLADFARIGSFTIAGRWKVLPHTEDEEKLFALLVTALDDESDAVRLQAAYYLSLLNDPRSEPRVERTRRDVLLKRLAAGTETIVREAWAVGPFADGDDETLAKPHEPEVGTLDLTATYNAAGRSIEWRRVELGGDGNRELPTAGGVLNSWYYAIRIDSDARRQALFAVDHREVASLRVNGTVVKDRLSDDAAWIVDLQPGGNEILLRLQDAGAVNSPAPQPTIRVQATGKLQPSLPEKLDSGVLAARLREASAVGGGRPIGAEFLEKDWSKEHLSGDPAAGRKLFGTLGCAKCHAIVPDQKSAGAPSLFEARRRFTVPHLVESLLLPSRQVAEPFRSQQITTDDGLALTGLVTAETTENVELLLPDASRRTVAKKQIEDRTPTTLSPMPQGLVKTPDELRHLLAYLLSERPLPP
jgi:putative heme-binding domain-containing protein